jgi:hypothetical protein
MHRVASPRLALALGALLLVVFAACIPLLSLTHQLSLSQNLPLLIAIVPFGVVGCIVAYRQPENAIGWILLALAVLGVGGLDAGLYATLRYHRGYTGLPLGPLAAVISPVEWMSVLILLPLPVMLFPDGRLPSGRWRWVAYAYGVTTLLWVGGILALTLDGLLVRRFDVDSSGSLRVVDQPTGVWELVNVLPTLGYIACAFAAIVVQIRAFRRAFGERRQQLKWLLGGGAVCMAGLTLTLVQGNNPTGIFAYIGNLTLCLIAALPIGIGVGILKYRLYEIDRLISRTISYTIVTGLLVAVFLGLVLVTTRALPFSSPVGVAAATLAAAALFSPLRRRTQRVVDRRFNRARYDAEAIVASFSARLRDAVDPETVHAELLTAVERAIEPAHASVWVRP